MPATPSPSRRKRASPHFDKAQSTAEQAVENGPTADRDLADVQEAVYASYLPQDLSPRSSLVGLSDSISLCESFARLFRCQGDLDALMRESAALACISLGGPSILYKISKDHPVSFVIGAFHPPEAWVREVAHSLLDEHVRTGRGLLVRPLAEGRPVMVLDLTESDLPVGLRSSIDGCIGGDEMSLTLFPIDSGRRRLGVLANISRRGEQRGEGDIAQGAALAGLIAAALDCQNTLCDLRKALKIRDMSISVASHELRNALATTRSLVQMSLRALRGGGEGNLIRVENHLEAMMRQIDWLTDLGRNVFDVSRIDDGHLELRREPTSINSVVVGVVERFRDVLVEHKKHRLSVELPKAQLTGRWDRDRIDQVLTNLLANAIKYSPNGGPLTIRVERRAMDPAECKTDETRRTTFDRVPMAVVAVSDRGIGIPADQLGTIFEPYYRATNVPKELGGSLGLGLHICKGIVEAHGGSLWVESEEGRGSTFYFSLPLDTT